MSEMKAMPLCSLTEGKMQFTAPWTEKQVVQEKWETCRANDRAQEPGKA